MLRPNEPLAARHPRKTPAAKKRPSWTIFNFWLDALLGVVFLLLLWTSVVLHVVFPPAAQSDGWTLWSRTYQQWADFQFFVMWVLALGVLVHVTLHWSWICGVVTSRLLPAGGRKKIKLDDGTRTLYGVGVIIAVLNLLGLAVALAVLTIQQP